MAPSDRQITPAPPPRPSLCTCTTLGRTRSIISALAVASAAEIPPVSALAAMRASETSPAGASVTVSATVMLFTSIVRSGGPSLRQSGPVALVLAPFADGDLDGLAGAATDHVDGHRLADAVAAEQRLEIVGVAERLAFEADEDVAEQQAALRGGAVGFHADDHQADLARPPGALAFGQLHRLAADAQVAALDRAVLRQALGVAPGDGRRDRQG